MSARLVPGGGGGRLNPPEPLTRFRIPEISRKPFATASRINVIVDSVPAIIERRTPLAKKPPTTPAETQTVKRGV